MFSPLITIGSIIILVALSGLFSQIESALISLNHVKVHSLVKQKKKGADILYKIKKDPHRALISLMICNDLVKILASSLAAVFATDQFGNVGLGVATGIMTLFILIFGEIFPKMYGIKTAEQTSLITAKPVYYFSNFLSPISRFLELSAKLVAKLLGAKEPKLLSEEEIRMSIAMGVREGVIDKHTGTMVKKLIGFEKINVPAIMTPRRYIKMISANQKLKNILSFVLKENYRRFPVYDKTEDNIVGIVNIDDLITHIKKGNLDTPIKKLMKKVMFIPETKDVESLLIDLEEQQKHLAIVVDEYSKVVGLVTTEDILEELVGDIFQKAQHSKFYIRKINDQIILVDANTSLEELKKFVGLNISAIKSNTIGGYLESKFNYIPKKGESLKIGRTTFQVGKVTKQGIQSIKIIKQ